MLVPGLVSIVMAVSPIRAVGLLVEGQSQNLAVSRGKPLIEWRVDDSRPGSVQTAFEVRLGGGGGMQTFGKVKSGVTHFELPTDSLKSRTEYGVSVRLWDRDGKAGDWSPTATFRMLTLGSKWPAKWIQAKVDVPPVKKGQNGYHSELEKTPDVEKWIEIDLGSKKTIETVRLFPSQPIDWNPPTRGFLFPLRYRVEVDGVVVARRDDEDQPIPQNASARIGFDPVEGRRVRLVVTKLRERNPGFYGLSLAEITVGSDSTGAKASAKDSLENNLWSVKNLTNGDLESHGMIGYEALPTQQLVKELALDEVPKRAFMHVAALGSYQLSINGKRVDGAALTPDWTDYLTRVGVQTYDVASFLKVGRNRIEFLLGDGWYAGRLGMSQALHPEGRPRGVYGRVPMVRAELELLPFGTGWAPGGAAGLKPTSIFSDATWMATTEGPVRSSDMLDGEVLDLNATLPPIDQGNWSPAVVGKPVKTPELDPQIAEPIRVTQTLTPISTKRLPDGRVVLDFGQNLVGRAKFKLAGEPYTKVTVRYAEMLADDGSVYTANLRGAPQIDSFFMNGKSEWFQTHFTYHGFRYAELAARDRRDSPIPMGAQIEAIAEVFHTSAPETASFACSEPMFERLWQNVVWTQRANLMSVPTDCPQRDERLGWTGDIHAFGQTASYIMDMRNFWRKWLIDMRDAQATDGRYADFAPHPYGKNDRFTGVPGWGDAGVVCTQTAWRNYADRRLAAEMLPSIDRWLKWIESKNPDHIWRNARHNDYGDWLNGDTLIQEGWPKQGAELPKEVFATLMWYQSARAAEELARASEGDASAIRAHGAMANKVQVAFLKEFVDAEGKIKGDTQAGYAIALGLDILPEATRPKAFAHLLAAIERAQNHISTGFHSTHHLMQVLTRFGRSDVAYMLLSNRTFPGWGYSIEQGATTIWERWDGFVKGRGFQDPGMNSFNHWAFGSVGEWMMGTIIGIQPGSPGWRTFTIAPEPGAGLTWAKGHYDSPQGRIGVSWNVQGDTLEVDVEVPANTKARVQLPPGWSGTWPSEVGAGRYALKARKS